MRKTCSWLLSIGNMFLILAIFKLYAWERRVENISIDDIRPPDINDVVEIVREDLLRSTGYLSPSIPDDIGDVDILYSAVELDQAQHAELDKILSSTSSVKSMVLTTSHVTEGFHKTISYTTPDVVSFVDELQKFSNSAQSSSAATSYHFAMAEQLSSGIFVILTKQNFAKALLLIPEINRRFDSWVAKKNWVLLNLGETDRQIVQVVNSQYLKHLASFALLAPAVASKDLIIQYIQIKVCSLESAVVGVRTRDPFHCAKNSGLVRYDLY